VKHIYSEKGFCEERSDALSWAKSKGSNLPKTTGMPKQYTIMDFAKSHERLLHFVRRSGNEGGYPVTSSTIKESLTVQTEGKW